MEEDGRQNKKASEGRGGGWREEKVGIYLDLPLSTQAVSTYFSTVLSTKSFFISLESTILAAYKYGL
jgi:hypothetical protein